MSSSRIKLTLKYCLLLFNCFFLFPHLIVFRLHRNRVVVEADINRWLHILQKNNYKSLGLIYLLSYYPEFRNLFYHRIGAVKILLNIICPRMKTLFIATDQIGEGLFIQHGFATIIAAKSIGRNCWINQQVTIGYSNNDDCPTIQDNVIINAGAKVIGSVTIGKGSKVGANAVVVKNVPEDCTVVGVPAYIIKKKGLRVNEKL